ncbi:putative RNA helicase armi [Glossina fuscipes fuscipes]
MLNSSCKALSISLHPPHHPRIHSACRPVIITLLEERRKHPKSGRKLKIHRRRSIGQYRVTIGTCDTFGNFLQMSFPSNHFRHAAGQCTEPEIMVAVAQVSKEHGKAVLAGDPHHLQAVIINEYARERGLPRLFSKTILSCAPYLRNFDRFALTYGFFDPRVVIRLLHNYRALSSMLNVYNELLIPMITEENSRKAKMLKQLDDILPQSPNRPKTRGIFFHGLRSKNMQEHDSPSWCKPYEAKHVFLMTVKLYRNNIYF